MWLAACPAVWLPDRLTQMLIALNLLKLSGLVLLLGGPLFYLLAWYPSFAGKDELNNLVRERIRRGVIIGAVVYPAALIVQLWVTGAGFVSIGLLNLLLVPMWVVLHTRAGNTPDHRSVLLHGLMSLLILTVEAGGSHAAADPGFLPYVVQVVHLLAAVIWAGGLCSYSLLPWKQLAGSGQTAGLYELDRRFYRIVLYLFLAVVVAGAILGFAHVHSAAALQGTPYGTSLLWKLGLVVPLVLLLCLHLPGSGRLLKGIVAVGANPDGALGKYRRLLALELCVMLGVLAASVLMRNYEPPDTAPFLNPQVLNLSADGQSLRISMQPVAGNLNGVRIEFFVPAELAGDATRVHYHLSLPQADLTLAEQEAIRVSADSYQGESTFPLPGDWQLMIRLTMPDGRTSESVSVLPIPSQPLVGDLATWLSPEAVLYSPSRIVTALAGILLVLVYGVWMWKAGNGTVPPTAALAGAAGVLFGLYLFLSVALVRTYPTTYDTNPLPLTASVVARGQQSYANQCAECHGPAGRGDGQWALERRGGPIPDLGSPHMDVHTDGEIYWWIVRGIPELDMPAREQELGFDQRWEIVNYLRSLRHGTTGP